MINKITKKYAMELLNGKVQLIGSYPNTEPKFVNTFICNNQDRLEDFLAKADIRECVSQSNTQIKYKLPNNEYTYFTSMTNSKWYYNEIYNRKYIFIETQDNFTIAYHIVED